MQNAWHHFDQIPEGFSLTLRGYIYRSPEGRYILSNHPNLKSCCIGASHELDTQLFLCVKEAPLESHKPYEVSGKFQHCLKTNEAGMLIEKYSLSDVMIQPVENSHGLSIVVFGAICLIIAIKFIQKKIVQTRASSSSLKR